MPGTSPPGPSGVRELRHPGDPQCSVGEFDNNAYLLTCRSDRASNNCSSMRQPTNRAYLPALVAEGTGALGGIVTTHRRS
ncbi:MAG: hypothetical protein IPF90_10660 [Actinomycetales bacterium]|nr:hypothetical protein [Candidatus Phosphoribacter baldrii]